MHTTTTTRSSFDEYAVNIMSPHQSELHVVRIGQSVYDDANRDPEGGLPGRVVAVMHVLHSHGGAVQVQRHGVEKVRHLCREGLDPQVGQPTPLRHSRVDLAEPGASSGGGRATMSNEQ